MILLVILLIIVLVMFLSIYNKLTKLKLKVKQSQSTIEVYCQQRFDLIPNLVSAVKGYMNYENKTLENITALRTKYEQTKDLETSGKLNTAIDYIMAVSENYPDLKASEQFLNLQKSLSKMESQLQAARRLYNIDVTNYNTKIETFPNNVFASILGFKKAELFQTGLEELKNISIEFGNDNDEKK